MGFCWVLPRVPWPLAQRSIVSALVFRDWQFDQLREEAEVAREEAEVAMEEYEKVEASAASSPHPTPRSSIVC